MGRRKRWNKHKRLFPVKYAAHYIPVSRMDPNKLAVYNSQRSKSTLGPRSNSDHNKHSNFMVEVPQTRNLSTQDYVLDGKTGKRKVIWVRSERGLVVDRKHEELRAEATNLEKKFEAKKGSLYTLWQGKRHQGVATYQAQIFERTGNYLLVLYFEGLEFIFVSETQTKRWISRTYTGLQAARQAYFKDKIAWIKSESIED